MASPLLSFRPCPCPAWRQPILLPAHGALPCPHPHTRAEPDPSTLQATFKLVDFHPLEVAHELHVAEPGEARAERDEAVVPAAREPPGPVAVAACAPARREADGRHTAEQGLETAHESSGRVFGRHMPERPDQLLQARVGQRPQASERTSP
ncbi:hypothetical protein Micbo1qcDRAFT_227087 [Microdochium bolleyi]|uniref:Uncharacterized protein n=1 Tax=Microdochium bolleyi TaxID=196109 RepID=A0A136IYI3_9PEZI|nr:hypothetical protein Micbo1qcDRAFT_227087 [Microdochium bolleyi]